MSRSDRGNTAVQDAPATSDGSPIVSDENVDMPAAETGTPAVAGETVETVGKAPARAPLHEGYVTPIGLAKELSKVKDGTQDSVKPQVVYSYIKNASKDFPFPSETIDGRFCVKLDAGMKWFADKDERVAAKKANAAEKAAAKAAKPAKETTPVAETEAQAAVVEAE